ncbi:MAG TPA: aspartyl/asparaginyl beta-hydroxylase domain-containing protein [Acidimicrobiia bacterium]|nr:aspartyl/asparaginyl beta-hydroxylase domain-containing protein [Acidimicrobiia bacterium]
MQLWDRVVAATNVVGDRILRAVNRLLARASVLPDQPFYDPADFAWVEPLEADWKLIRAELDAVLARRDELPNFQDISTDQYHLTDDDRWKTYFLYGYGFRSDANCARCPQTTRLVESIPGMTTAMFSILAPGKHIPPHDGPYKGVLRYHLGLLVPEPAENVGITVGGELAHWREGGSLVFDDTYTHEAWNDTDGTRVVLFVDVIRELREPMRTLNRWLITAIAWSPFIQDAKRRHIAWEARFDRMRGTGTAP